MFGSDLDSIKIFSESKGLSLKMLELVEKEIKLDIIANDIALGKNKNWKSLILKGVLSKKHIVQAESKRKTLSLLNVVTIKENTFKSVFSKPPFSKIKMTVELEKYLIYNYCCCIFSIFQCPIYIVLEILKNLYDFEEHNEKEIIFYINNMYKSFRSIRTKSFSNKIVLK